MLPSGPLSHFEISSGKQINIFQVIDLHRNIEKLSYLQHSLEKPLAEQNAWHIVGFNYLWISVKILPSLLQEREVGVTGNGLQELHFLWELLKQPVVQEPLHYII